jgi:hypothetical protein
MTKENDVSDDETDTLQDLQAIGTTKVAPAHGIAAIALNMALKYYNINTVQDGQLYQQYKLEGRNMRELHLDMVFETAIKIEMHLLGASERIAKLVVEAIAIRVETDKTLDEPPNDLSGTE